MQLNGKNFDWQRGANAAYAKLAGAKSIAVFNGTKSFQAITVHRIGKGAVYLIGPSLFRYSALHKRLGDADAEGRFILNEAGISVQALQKLYRTIILSSPNVAQTAPVKSSWGIKPLGKAGKLTYTDVKFHNQPEFKCSMIESMLRLPRHFDCEKRMRARAKEILRIVDLENERNILSCNLPYGKQRKLEIARALATNPKILLLDEPAAGMNPNETEDLAQTIRFIRDNFDMTILLIEHDMRFVSELCDELTVLSFGTVLAQGDTKTVLQDPEVIKAYIGG